MPLGRSLTRRLGRGDNADGEQPTFIRSFSTRKSAKDNSTSSFNISSPVSLISTTNALSYDAPDVKDAQLAITIPAYKPQSQGFSTVLDNQTPVTGSTGTEPELTEGSSLESTPHGSPTTSPPPIMENHLSCYFPGPTIKRAQSTTAKRASADSVPQIPTRVPSHSKKEHQRVAGQRKTLNGPTVPGGSFLTPISDLAVTDSTLETSSQPDRHDSDSLHSFKNLARHSAQSLKTTRPPFASELGELSESIEDTASTVDSSAETLSITEFNNDKAFMISHGLAMFTAEDYIAEIGCNNPFLSESLHERMLAQGFF